jgi:CYTH domain-containing protein
MQRLKKLRESLKLRTLRWAALALCAAILAVSLPAGLASRQSDTEASLDIPGLELAQLLVDPFGFLENFFNGLFDAFWSTFSFLDFMAYPRSGLVYNDKTAFQSAFGYNRVYDMFAFMANVYADTIRCKFSYDGRDWMVQLWKGAYAGFLCTGGEIGVYSKPASRMVEHYDSVQESPGDWLGMEMTIYNRGELLFTRPFDQYWWCTGYQVGYLHGFYKSPRTDCVMRTRLQFKNAEMAALFADELALKGFVLTPYLPEGIDLTECYALDGDTVSLVWRETAE